jgi:hypothetical protein
MQKLHADLHNMLTSVEVKRSEEALAAVDEASKKLNAQVSPPPSSLHRHPPPLHPHPTPSALNPAPSTLNPQPSTLNPQPSTLYLQP